MSKRNSIEISYIDEDENLHCRYNDASEIIAELEAELALKDKTVQEIQNHNCAMKEAICARHGGDEFWNLYRMATAKAKEAE